MAMLRLYYIVALIVSSLLGGCATPTTRAVEVDQALVDQETRKQKEIALQSQFNAQKRLMDVSYPILAASAPLCGSNVRSSLGVVYANKYTFEPDLREVAEKAYDMGEWLKVVQVLPGSPGELAGLQVGDTLMAINGQAVPTGDEATKRLFVTLDQELSAEMPTRVSLSRDGVQIDTEIVPAVICDSPVVVVQRDEVNAFADGQKVGITRGMMRFARDDEELALVVAHELAHNAMAHGRALQRNRWLGSIVDIFAGAYGVNTQGVFGSLSARAYSKEFEAEADYVGLYMMAVAGLNIDDVAQFWRRMAAEHPGGIQKSFLATHPTAPERFVAIEKTVEEIKAKIAAGLPLEPEYR